MRLAIFVALAVTTCNVVPLGDGPRRASMRRVADDVIAPTLDALVARTAALQTSLDALAAGPTQVKLEAAREAWRASRVPWKETEAFGFGPATDDRLAAAIDQAIDPARIDDELAGTTPLTPAYVASFGANKKGFHAIEYLLFSDAGVAAQRRRDYLSSLGSVVATDATTLRDAWARGYLALVIDPGPNNATFPTIQQVVDTFVNESVFVAEMLADLRLGKPLGHDAGGTPAPELEESGPSDNSLADLASSLRGMQAVYATGIGPLVAARSSGLDRDVTQAFVDALDAVEAVPRPFATAVVDHGLEVEAAFAAVKELQRLLATEVVATLGATLKFNGNDGD